MMMMMMMMMMMNKVMLLEVDVNMDYNDIYKLSEYK